MTTPIGPYTPVVQAGPWLITSGQLGLRAGSPGDPPALVEGGPAAQLSQALSNAGALLAEHGASPADIVKTTVFVTDMGGYADVNQAYVAFFGDHRPARSVVGVAGLPLGAAVEVEVWAYRPG
jgi:2-iminobutanoate/2-iminopropanoate deaminase